MPKRAAAAERIVSDLEWLAGDPRGRRILWRLWQSTGIFGPAVVDNALQAFAEGRRSVGLEYWQHIVTLSPTAASLALTENSGSAADGGRKRNIDTLERRELAERWADLAGPDEPEPGVGPATTDR